MHFKITFCILISTCAAALPLSAETVFSNDFEDGNLEPEIGTWTFNNDSTTSVVPISVAGDAILGDTIGLIDQLDLTLDTTLDLSLNLTNTVSLTDGNVVTLDFDVAARRTTGNTKTIFVDALDSSGAIVVRFVLGDSNSFGNGGNDRQRPGHDPTSDGAANTANSLLPAPSTPGSFWWGSDSSVDTFDVVRDAHFTLTFSASSFDISSTRAAGATYSATGINNRDGGTFADIASFRLTSAGDNYGIWVDNIVVTGELAQEPAADIEITDLNFDPASRDTVVTFTSEAGVSYVPSISMDLVNWQPLEVVVAEGTETEFIDFSVPVDVSRRFYRFSVAP